MSFEPVWHPPAEEDLLHVPWQDAAWVAREVNNLAENGVGDVRIEQMASGRRVYFLILPGVRVIISFDRPARIMHVWRVWRSVRPTP